MLSIDWEGYLTSWEAEKAIWDTILFNSLNIEPSETSFLVTEPPLDLPILQAAYDQIVFEEYEFHSYSRAIGTTLFEWTNEAPSFVPFHTNVRGSLAMSECTLVIDSGFSFTHVIPIVQGKVLWSAVKRCLL